MLRVGQIAPDFDVLLHTSEIFRLHDQRGKRHVVLYFYPRDFTYGCTKEACSFTNHFDEIRRLSATIIGVSPDPLETHRLFAEQYRITFPLASDPTYALARLYDAVWFHGMSMKRITYVIDKQGLIRLAVHHELLVASHWRKTVETVKQLAVEQP